VLVVDDHDVFRTELRTLLGKAGLEVVGEAASGVEAIDLAGTTKPDVVVMDLHMPEMDGLEATRRMAATDPPMRVLVLTVSDQDEDVIGAILAGASGYLLKDAPLPELLRGIQATARGESLVSPPIAAKVLHRLRSTVKSPEDVTAARGRLSGRELEVLKLIANGKDNAEIAAELCISPKTVKNHISKILMKLRIENRIQAAVYAVRSGIV
jgi:DNA-binding NarL/FixJ family response regulator